MKGGSGKPNHMTYGCPCSTGLTCHGSGMYDIPLGEMGRLKNYHGSAMFDCNFIAQRTLVITTVFVSKDFAVKSN